MLLDGFPFRPRVRDVVKVVDAKSARKSIVILAFSPFKHGMESEDGKFLLQFRFDVFILFFGEFTLSTLLQCVFYFGTDSGYMHRIEHSVEKFGGTFPNLTSYIFSYSKFHRCDV
jgi:hypothetical protein